MPAKPRSLAAPSTPADWKAIEEAATAELARRTQLAHQQIIGLLGTHGHLLSDAQRRALGKRLQRSGK
ncbi:hypothetical protein [Xanthomonas vesicatoria]|uniref:Uncharacterized protein n=1 Tax=Xanthomonas vesicatoria TaxID=56460 RepID=A0AAJ0N4M7_9XANT|nr:hypothetical protein [Xanthomonas vesicatoria]APO94502.1 hypothetical protein BI313_07710 [Xanthomonas vesicatoria]KHM90544.1 hypothetical protein OR60_21700 [Xanthomonas vesicatoria]KHM95883.1 hypothetical protein OR61_07950 [Xanthomonas vesicatoria]MCC8621101.1 hypothetical protein [Xanthomonas vesicatoria]MCC8692661.1 hypothetical protein [Xanthomonas vesicatoria]